MAITWGNLHPQIARKLNDEAGRRYSEELLRDAVNDALRAFASSHTGLVKTHQVVGDGATATFPLPADMVESRDAGVVAVEWTSGYFLQRMEPFPGTTLPPAAYLLLPNATIRFGTAPTSGQTVTIYYVAYYPAVVDNTSEIAVPGWAVEAIKLYTAAVALDTYVAKAANLGQYKSRRESGEPEDNPLQELARYYFERYNIILSLHPAPQYELMMGVK